MTFPRIDSDDLTAYFDDEHYITYVVYRGVLTDQQTLRVYAWMGELLKAAIAAGLGLNDLYGSVYDFREVTNFKQYNLSTVMRESQKVNTKMNLSHVPVALLVQSPLQEELLRIALKLTPQDYRKKVVHSEQEALDFIEQWHHEHGD
ncbi:MAG: hypothetical protein D6712_13665 [Chloroflexi bacterium]|nr:MAG: hypothetical protein D6712_13665 [Chloroflexota bacterium]